jgi:hypothetical protein
MSLDKEGLAERLSAFVALDPASLVSIGIASWI